MQDLKNDNYGIQGNISDKNQNTFELYISETETERTVKGLRQLPLEGQSNFRDLGGYKTIDQKTVKWGLLFRSGQLSKLTDKDLHYLSTIPLKTIIDFRSEEEAKEQVSILPFTVSNEVLLPIKPGNLSKNNAMQIVMDANDELAHKLLVDINEQLVLHNQDEYKAFFKEVERADAPLMFNCTAGKDRTGLAAALLLTALGVDKNTIREDYLLTNQCVSLDTLQIQEQFRLNDEQANVLLTLFTVKEQYLDKALFTIEQHYDTVENFLIEALDVDVALLKSKYLY